MCRSRPAPGTVFAVSEGIKDVDKPQAWTRRSPTLLLQRLQAWGVNRIAAWLRREADAGAIVKATAKEWWAGTFPEKAEW